MLLPVRWITLGDGNMLLYDRFSKRMQRIVEMWEIEEMLKDSLYPTCVEALVFLRIGIDNLHDHSPPFCTKKETTFDFAQKCLDIPMVFHGISWFNCMSWYFMVFHGISISFPNSLWIFWSHFFLLRPGSAASFVRSCPSLWCSCLVGGGPMLWDWDEAGDVRWSPVMSGDPQDDLQNNKLI